MNKWETEPDKHEWEHAGLQCCIVRVSELGHLCGYVGVPKSHPLYEIRYNASSDALTHLLNKRMKSPVGPVDDLTFPECVALLFGEFEASPEFVFKCHGGLTYSEHRNPAIGKDDGLWWFGFDCAHCGDFQPLSSYSIGGVYRDFKYVKVGVESLAEQIAGVK
jgi:hypothetical protein